jgi:1-acyl-sn-glycerol-3-phosphate acyltransferase
MDVTRHAPFPPGPAILVANHPSMIDPAIVTLLAPCQMRILILDTLFKVPFFGRSLRWSGHIPVVCGQGRAALEQARACLKAGQTVVVFPEGVISTPGERFHPPHSGMARLALETQTPVIPLGIALDPNQIRLIHTKVKGNQEVATWYFTGPYAISMGDPLLFSGSADDRLRVSEVTGLIMQRIGQLTTESSLRIRTRSSYSHPAVAGLRSLWQLVYRSIYSLAGAKII